MVTQQNKGVPRYALLWAGFLKEKDRYVLLKARYAYYGPVRLLWAGEYTPCICLRGGLALPPGPPLLKRGGCRPLALPALEVLSLPGVFFYPMGSSCELLEAPFKRFLASKKSQKQIHTFLKLIFFSYSKAWDPSHLLSHAQNTSSHALPNS